MLDGNDRIESQIKICLYDSSKTGSRATMTKRNFSVGFSEADDYGYWTRAGVNEGGKQLGPASLFPFLV